MSFDAAAVPEGRTARIRVPASTSNLGAAFDAVGLALRLYLTVEVSRLEAGISLMEFAGQDAHLVPADHTNLIWRTMAEVAAAEGVGLPPFVLKVANQIPITKGLGSSASAILAGAAAAGFLCRLQLTSERLLGIAAALEGHPDNVAPALYGGLVASISGERILCSRSEFPEDWTVVAVTPDFELETKRARAVLPDRVPHKDAVYNVQRAAFLMAQLIQGRKEGLREAMADALHQPYRSGLLPGLGEVLALPPRAGLLGAALSGAGSTVIAFADSRANEIGEEIRSIFARHGLSSQVRLLRADNEGLSVVATGH
jgi:homoserine kinase